MSVVPKGCDDSNAISLRGDEEGEPNNDGDPVQDDEAAAMAAFFYT